MSTITQLELGPEFKQPTPGLKDQISELLTGTTPVFLNSVARYEEILAAASEANEELDRLIDRSDPESVHYDKTLVEIYVNLSNKSPFDPRVQEFRHRHTLRETAGMVDDVSSLLRSGGGKLASKVKTILPMGPHRFGQHVYFLERDPRQDHLPGRLNFYKLSEANPYPVAFGSTVSFDLIQEPFKPANAIDVVWLVRDLQVFSDPS